MAEIIDPKIAPDVQSLFPGEEVDFAVKAKKQPIAAGIIFLVMGLTLVATVLAFGGLLADSIFNANSPLGPKRYIFVIVFIMMFIGAMVCLIMGLRFLFWNQVWYVGTDKRIAKLEKKKLESYGWEKFFQEVGKTGTNEKGSVILTPKPEAKISAVMINGIANCDAIQEACHKRIIDTAKPNSNTITLEEFMKTKKTGTLT